MLSFSIAQKIAVWVLPVLLAITLHEAAHAFAAYRLGDSTAKMLGRLSINPLKHVDPIGTIAVPLLVGLSTNFQFVFGWAKPVPVNWAQLNHPRRDIAIVAGVGPLSNIIMACGWALLLKLGLALDPRESMLGLFLVLSGQAGIIINLVLACLNILPIPPLDGSRILRSLLPPQNAILLDRIEPYGTFVVLALMLTGTLNTILLPMINAIYDFIMALFHL